MFGSALAIAIDRPPRCITPGLPFVFAFALGDIPAPVDGIVPGNIFTVSVANGAHPPYDAVDWFSTRVPAMPAHTGPLHVDGLAPGDLFEIAVLAIDAADPACQAPLTVTLTVPGPGIPPVQAVVPAGSVVRLRAPQPGGLLVFGPLLICSEPGHFGSTEPLAGHVTARCTVVPMH